MLLTPVLGEAATTSWPPWRRMGAVFEPIRPVPPMMTIFMFRVLSIGSECSPERAFRTFTSLRASCSLVHRRRRMLHVHGSHLKSGQQGRSRDLGIVAPVAGTSCVMRFALSRHGT